ncbi:CATRA system-associated protein [Pseudonocardia endophytica]|uniref:CATRA-Associated Small Protein domain-containing protein n=1 Tax=Pseudonocardia endophytica TaxID=401976 RepID=A0A4V2PHV8_PSEEN|nr:CATRA system-associated protein [Pseudonocardia endophytica]TCK22266.1 hypothetical protein EV378_6267 [Pseudonocardia endophytica]
MPDHRLVLDEDLRADAIDVLKDAASWSLGGPRWGAVAGALSTMGDAARAGDVDAFRRAVYALELAGPVRAVGADEQPVVTAPETVRVEIGRLSGIVESAETDEG